MRSDDGVDKLERIFGGISKRGLVNLDVDKTPEGTSWEVVWLAEFGWMGMDGWKGFRLFDCLTKMNSCSIIDIWEE